MRLLSGRTLEPGTGLIGYVRTGAVGKAGDVAVADQMNQLNAFAQKHGVSLTHFYIEREIEDAHLSLMLPDLEAARSQPRAVLVTDLSRLARCPQKLGELQARLSELGADLLIVKDSEQS